MAVIVIFRFLAAAVDEQILFFVEQIHDVPFADLVIRGHLDGHGRAGFGAEAAEDAPGEVDPEPFGITATVLLLSRLHRDAVHRAGG